MSSPIIFNQPNFKANSNNDPHLQKYLFTKSLSDKLNQASSLFKPAKANKLNFLINLSC
jgi:hypothetical protein